MSKFSKNDKKYKTHADLVNDLGEKKALEWYTQEVFDTLKAQTLEEEERLGFNKKANYMFWSKIATWTNNEAAALTLNIAPENLNAIAIQGFSCGLREYSQTLLLYNALNNIIANAIEAERIKVTVSGKIHPSDYFELLDSLNIPFPPTLKNTIKKPIGRTKGAEGINDDASIQYMNELITNKKALNPNKAAKMAYEKFGQTGASMSADLRRLTEKYKKFYGD